MRVFCAVAALMLAGVPSASAQEQSGSLQGKVADSSNAMLPGVTVSLAGPAMLGGARTTFTTDSGTYRFTNIPVGTYTVTFELAGFTHEGLRRHPHPGGDDFHARRRARRRHASRKR